MDRRSLPQLPGTSERARTPPRSIREFCSSRPPFAKVEVGTVHWQNNIEQRVQKIEKRIEKAANIINQYYESHPVPTREVKSCLTIPRCQPCIANVAVQNCQNPPQQSSRVSDNTCPADDASKHNSRRSSSQTKLANDSDSKYDTCLEETYGDFQQGELLSSTAASSSQFSTQQSSARSTLKQQASSLHASTKENLHREVWTQQASTRRASAKESSNRHYSFITLRSPTKHDTTLRPPTTRELSRSPLPKVSDERKTPKCVKGCKSKCAKRDPSEKRCTRKVKRH